MPPVRQNDQMVQFDGRQDVPPGVRLLNEPVAEFLRGSGVCHVEMDCDWKYNNNTINNDRCGIV